MVESCNAVERANRAVPGREKRPDICGQAKILITEDDTFYRKSVSRFIENNGYISLEAGNGRDALEVLRNERPGLILTDLRMPVMDGFELLSELAIESPETPVIVFSGLDGNTDIINAFRCGAVDYIEKPIVDTRVLLDRIEKAFSRMQDRAGWTTEMGQRISRMPAPGFPRLEAWPGDDEWARLADSLHEPIAMFDTGHRLLQLNRAMAEILGEPRSDLIGSVRYLSSAGLADKKRARQDLGLLRHHEVVSGRFFEREQGAFLEVKITPHYARDGLSLAGCVYIARDIAHF